MPLPIFLPSCSTPPLLYIAGMDSLLSGSLHEILVLIIGGVPRVCRGGGGCAPDTQLVVHHFKYPWTHFYLVHCMHILCIRT